MDRRYAIDAAMPLFKGISRDLVPDDENDRRGQVPSAEECAEIEREWGLTAGCTLLMNGAKWYYVRVGTFGEEEGEKPCLWAYKIRDCGTTSEVMSLLNVWRVE